MFLQSLEGFVSNSGDTESLIETALLSRLTILKSSDGYLALFGNTLKWLNSSFFSSDCIFSTSITITCLKSLICALQVIRKFVHQIKQ